MGLSSRTQQLATGLAALALVAACTSAEQGQQNEIMEAIEREIQLPAEAAALDRYARAYKRASPTRIVAFYFIRYGKPNSFSCTAASENGPSNGQILMRCPPPDGMAAGERRWLDDAMSLPGADDGGCDYVDVEYDLDTKSFVRVSCHGN